MNHTYEWLYDYYAEPTLEKIFAEERNTLLELIQTMPLPREDVVRLADTVETLHTRWGAEVFALGVQMGARLVMPHGGTAPTDGSLRPSGDSL